MATERNDSDFHDPGSSADRSFTNLVAIRGDHDSEDLGNACNQSTENGTSPSLVPSPQEDGPSSAVGDAQVGDVVKVYL